VPAADESSPLLVPASVTEDDAAVVVIPIDTDVVVSPVLVVIDASEPPERPLPPGSEGPLQAGTSASTASLIDARTRASYANRSRVLN
jgi:hypothetical protein